MFQDQQTIFFQNARIHYLLGNAPKIGKIVRGIGKYDIVFPGADLQEIEYIMTDYPDAGSDIQGGNRIPYKTSMCRIHFHTGCKRTAPGDKFK